MEMISVFYKPQDDDQTWLDKLSSYCVSNNLFLFHEGGTQRSKLTFQGQEPAIANIRAYLTLMRELLT
jgi:hypothetical protein